MLKILEKLSAEIKATGNEIDQTESLIYQATDPEEKHRLTHQRLDAMKRQEFLKAIAITMSDISKVEQQIKETPGRRERMHLYAKLRRLRYLQVWHMDQIGWDVFKIVK